MRLVKFRKAFSVPFIEIAFVDGADAILCDNDVNIFCFQTAQHGALIAAGAARYMLEQQSLTAALDFERWPRAHLVWVETVLNNQPACDVPMQRPDGARALVSFRVESENR
jgi:hypothetical protein